MYYTYNETTQSFGIYTNCKPEKLPEGYKEVTEKEYKKLIEVKEGNK